MMKKILIAFFIGITCLLSQEANCQKKNAKPRTIVTTDGEIDDVDSYIRMLLYANEFRIEGLVYSSSMWHYKGDGKGTKFTSEMDMTKKMYGEKISLRWPGSSWMNDLLGAYTTIYPNLIKHDPSFPQPSYLKSIVREGNIDFEGEMEKITAGSEFIKEKLLDNTTEPIYLQVWGGTNTIARALKSIEEQYKSTPLWAQIYKKVCDKAIIYAILDQDATYRKYIAPNWKDLKIFYNSNQFWCFAYPWQKAVPEPWKHYLEGKFMSENIIHNHGPLLKQYYSYGDGQQQAGDDEHLHGDLSKYSNPQWGSFNKYDFISEGDSPSYLHLVDVGLDNLNNPHLGGWGGRLVQSTTQPSRWEDGELAADFNPYTNKVDKTYPQTRWIETLQNDFAARADWCIKDYKDANHAPAVKLKSKNKITTSAGQKIKLQGSGKDPDGHQLIYKWWQYEEVGSYKGKVNIENANSQNASVTMPNNIKRGETIHIILEVKDNHEFPMTRYQRVVLTAK
jgi:hypothetical protein